jgi:hypothetical protein
LVDGEVHLPAFDGLAVLDLVPRVAEGGERLVLGIVDQDVPIGQEEDLRPAVLACPVPSGIPELPADLKGDDGFPVPVAIVSRFRRRPCKIAWTLRLMAISW